MNGYRIMGWAMTALAVYVLFYDGWSNSAANFVFASFIWLGANMFWDKSAEKRKAGQTREGEDGDANSDDGL